MRLDGPMKLAVIACIALIGRGRVGQHLSCGSFAQRCEEVREEAAPGNQRGGIYEGLVETDSGNCRNDGRLVAR